MADASLSLIEISVGTFCGQSSLTLRVTFLRSPSLTLRVTWTSETTQLGRQSFANRQHRHGGWSSHGNSSMPFETCLKQRAQ